MVSVRRNARVWCAYLACGGLGLIILVGNALSEQKQASDNNRKTTDKKNTPLPTASFGIAALPYSYACHPAKDAADENLCIERDAMTAAQEQAFWAELTFGIGVAGTVAVAVSLFYSIRATRATERVLMLRKRPPRLPWQH